MSLGTQFDSALAEISEMVGLSAVTIAGQVYACVRNARRHKSPMQSAGYFDDYSIEIIVRGSVLGAANVPAPNATVTLDGQACAVVEVIEPNVANGADKVFYKIRLREVV